MNHFFSIWLRAGFGVGLAMTLYTHLGGYLTTHREPPLTVACNDLLIWWALLGLFVALAHLRRTVTSGSAILSGFFIVLVITTLVYVVNGSLLYALPASLLWIGLLAVVLGCGVWWGSRLKGDWLPAIAALLFAVVILT